MARADVKEAMTQTAVRLPVAMRDRIRKEAGPRGLGAEIRRRLDEWQELHDAGYRITTKTTREIEKVTSRSST